MRNLAGIIGLNLRYLVLTNSISSTDDNRPINLKKRYRYTYKPAILLNDDSETAKKKIQNAYCYIHNDVGNFLKYFSNDIYGLYPNLGKNR